MGPTPLTLLVSSRDYFTVTICQKWKNSDVPYRLDQKLHLRKSLGTVVNQARDALMDS